MLLHINRSALQDRYAALDESNRARTCRSKRIRVLFRHSRGKRSVAPIQFISEEICVSHFIQKEGHLTDDATRPATFHFIWARNYLLPFLTKIGSPKFRRFVIDILPWKELRELRDVVDVLHNTAVEIIESKKKALAEGNDAIMRQVGQGKDIISILRASPSDLLNDGGIDEISSVKANMEASEAESLSEEELVGQVS